MRQTPPVVSPSTGDARAGAGWMTRLANNERATGLVCAFFVVTVWTTFLLFTRHGAKGTLTPFDLTALRFGVSAIFLLPYILRHALGGLGFWRALLLVVTAGPAFAMLAFGGFANAPAAHASVLMPGLLPLWTAGFAYALLGDRPSLVRLIGLVLIAGGVAALLRAVLADGSSAIRGDLMFAGASFSWAIFTVAARRWKVGALQATAVVAVGSALVYLPVYAIFLPKNLVATPWPELLAHAFFQGFIVVVVALWAYARAVETIGPAAITTILAIVPASSALLAIPLLDEPLDPANALGLVLVTIGMVVAVLPLLWAPKRRT